MSYFQAFQDAIKTGCLREAFLIAFCNNLKLTIKTSIISEKNQEVYSLQSHVNLLEGLTTEINKELLKDDYNNFNEFHYRQLSQAYQTLDKNRETLVRVFQVLAGIVRETSVNHIEDEEIVSLEMFENQDTKEITTYESDSSEEMIEIQAEIEEQINFEDTENWVDDNVEITEESENSLMDFTTSSEVSDDNDNNDSFVVEKEDLREETTANSNIELSSQESGEVIEVNNESLNLNYEDWVTKETDNLEIPLDELVISDFPQEDLKEGDHENFNLEIQKSIRNEEIGNLNVELPSQELDFSNVSEEELRESQNQVSTPNIDENLENNLEDFGFSQEEEDQNPAFNSDIDENLENDTETVDFSSFDLDAENLSIQEIEDIEEETEAFESDLDNIMETETETVDSFSSNVEVEDFSSQDITKENQTFEGDFDNVESEFIEEENWSDLVDNSEEQKNDSNTSSAYSSEIDFDENEDWGEWLDEADFQQHTSNNNE